MELTTFIEELLNIELKEYQKIAIDNFTKSNNKNTKRYVILQQYDNVTNDRFMGNIETYYLVKDMYTHKLIDVHESKIHKYKQ